MMHAILIVDDDATRLEQLAFELTARSDFRVRTASGAAKAISSLDTPGLRAIVCSEGNQGEAAIELLREARIHRNASDVAFVLVVRPNGLGTRIDAWSWDADAVLTEPVHAAEVQACLQGLLRRRSVNALAAEEVQRVNRTIEEIQNVLLTLLNAAFPHAERRGEELAGLSLRVARELNVPSDLHDELRRAARLHEVGRLLSESGPASRLEVISPSVLAASAGLLSRLPALTGTAKLIGGMAANWDGSGSLVHMERGEIPLRSRILRAAGDFLGVRAIRRWSPQVAMESLMLHSGTHYDPAVLAELALVVSAQDPQRSVADFEPLRVEHLTEGLMLVNDLCTASGVKLLSAGAVLTSASLRLIAERHAIDPIVHAVATRRLAR
ncbi:MAG TPA: HD domain-containing phosphohydrolase [Gemmatimonadales bacterium]|jgi:response regulator RpfG family c-di-GMP phosphodiesterase